MTRDPESREIGVDREFKDMAFEDVVFDNNSELYINNNSNHVNTRIINVRLKVTLIIIKHRILEHHIRELRS